jgi:hypothetical protein
MFLTKKNVAMMQEIGKLPKFKQVNSNKKNPNH